MQYPILPPRAASRPIPDRRRYGTHRRVERTRRATLASHRPTTLWPQL